MNTRRQEESASNRDRWRAAAAVLEQTPRSCEARSEGSDTIEGSVEQNRHGMKHEQEALVPLVAALEDRRRHKRRDWTARLHLTIEQNQGCGLGRREAEVQTKDLSRSGFSFIYRQYIPEGSVVTARIDSIAEAPTISGRVRRCVHMGGMDHLIGVEFTRVSRS